MTSVNQCQVKDDLVNQLIALNDKLNTLSPALLHSEQAREEVQQKRENLYVETLLSGYKPNRISWLELSRNSDWESNASNTCKMGTFSRLVMLKICRIW